GRFDHVAHRRTVMHACPEARQPRRNFILVFQQTYLLMSLEHQILQRVFWYAMPTWHVHREFFSVKIFDPAAFGEADLRVFEELNIGCRIRLQGRDEYVRDFFRLDAERGQCIQWALALLAFQTTALTER